MTDFNGLYSLSTEEIIEVKAFIDSINSVNNVYSKHSWEVIDNFINEVNESDGEEQEYVFNAFEEEVERIFDTIQGVYEECTPKDL